MTVVELTMLDPSDVWSGAALPITRRYVTHNYQSQYFLVLETMKSPN
jgi:hypothetical protein